MKTQEQLKKEIEEGKEWNEGNEDWSDLEDYSCGSCECHNFSKLLILQALLQYSNEIIEEIENWRNNTRIIIPTEINEDTIKFVTEQLKKSTDKLKQSITGETK